jgi:peroxiredoxin
MKYFVFLVLFCPMLLWSKPAVISGTLHEHTSDSMLLYGYGRGDEVNPQKILLAQTTVDANGKFFLKVDLAKSTEFNLKNGNDWIISNGFLSPGDSIVFDVRKDSFDINGKGADKILLGLRFVDTFYRKAPLGPEYKYAYVKLDTKDYVMYLDKRRALQLEFLKDNFHATSSDSDFVHYMTADINYKYGVDKLGYLWKHNYSLRKKGITDPGADYFKLPKDIPLENPQALFSPQYYFFLRDYVTALSDYKKDHLSPGKRKQFRELTAKFNIANKELHQPYNVLASLGIFLDRMQFPFYTAHQKEELDSLLEKWVNTTSDTHLIYIQVMRYRKAFGSDGKPAADFTLTSLDNKEVKLSQFRGAIVLLDFWETTCSGCLKEIPYANALQQRLKDRNFVMLDICFGTSKEAWKKIIQDRNWKGIHLYCEDSHFFEDNYGMINSFPQYVLIDRYGNIHTTVARSPSQNVAETIYEMLRLPD